MGEIATTKAERDLMLHALGIQRAGQKPYRNYFVAANEGDDAKSWQRLVSLGLAEGRSYPLMRESTLFVVTRAGKKVLGV